jgi:hypothetical protein
MFHALALLVALGQPAAEMPTGRPVADMPTIDVTPSKQTTGDDQRARALVEQYFQHLSGPDVLNKFQEDYAAYVDFYGKMIDRNTLLREKARFVRRWPERRYSPRQGSIQVACRQVEGVTVCAVSGLVDFNCRSADRHAISTGVARFKSSVAFVGDRPQIMGEESAVVS